MNIQYSVVQRAEKIPPRAENVNIFRPRCKHLVVFTMVSVNFFTTGGPLRTFFSHNFVIFLKFSEKIQGEVTRTGYWTPKQLKIVKRLMQSGAV